METDKCPNCGSENFIGIGSAYDRTVFQGGSRHIVGTDHSDFWSRVECAECNEIVDEIESEKQGKIILEDPEEK